MGPLPLDKPFRQLDETRGVKHTGPVLGTMMRLEVNVVQVDSEDPRQMAVHL